MRLLVLEIYLTALCPWRTETINELILKFKEFGNLQKCTEDWNKKTLKHNFFGNKRKIDLHFLSKPNQFFSNSKRMLCVGSSKSS